MNLPAWHAVPFGFWKMLKDKYRAFYNHDGEREYGVGIHIHIDHSSMTTGHLWLLMQFAYHMQTGELKQHLETISQRPDGEWGRYQHAKHETGQTNPETGATVYVDNLNEAIMLTAIREHMIELTSTMVLTCRRILSVQIVPITYYQSKCGLRVR